MTFTAQYHVSQVGWYSLGVESTFESARKHVDDVLGRHSSRCRIVCVDGTNVGVVEFKEEEV